MRKLLTTSGGFNVKTKEKAAALIAIMDVFIGLMQAKTISEQDKRDLESMIELVGLDSKKLLWELPMLQGLQMVAREYASLDLSHVLE